MNFLTCDHLGFATDESSLNERCHWKGVTTYYQATKFLMNPDIAEVVEFKKEFVATNGESGTTAITIITSETVSESDDFLKINDFTQIMNITEPNKLKTGTFDGHSQDNDVVSHCGENETPSTMDKTTSNFPKENMSTPSDLKRNLDELYEADDNAVSSSTKTRVVEKGHPLLIPKLEK
ncbi:hypothetical protein L2E82_27826 [Cichorium intybus]|uniref:Uncharacterized protein n=1 Tax=Cichorium intybus TaxID=13427 RepID=A0ACB9CTX9_CICIN|nr:hypothetical protein L2E82_27826 [Cichorium intybus]